MEVHTATAPLEASPDAAKPAGEAAARTAALADTWRRVAKLNASELAIARASLTAAREKTAKVAQEAAAEIAAVRAEAAKTAAQAAAEVAAAWAEAQAARDDAAKAAADAAAQIAAARAEAKSVQDAAGKAAAQAATEVAAACAEVQAAKVDAAKAAAQAAAEIAVAEAGAQAARDEAAKTAAQGAAEIAAARAEAHAARDEAAEAAADGEAAQGECRRLREDLHRMHASIDSFKARSAAVEGALQDALRMIRAGDDSTAAANIPAVNTRQASPLFEEAPAPPAPGASTPSAKPACAQEDVRRGAAIAGGGLSLAIHGIARAAEASGGGCASPAAGAHGAVGGSAASTPRSLAMTPPATPGRPLLLLTDRPHFAAPAPEQPSHAQHSVAAGQGDTVKIIGL